MHRLGGSLEILPALNIKHHTDTIVWYPHIGGVPILEHLSFLPLHPLRQRLKLVTRKRGKVELRDSMRGSSFWVLHTIGGRMECTYSIFVHCDMIGMTIAARFIKGDHDLWAKLANDGNHLPNYISRASIHQSLWIVVRWRSSHTRVTIIKKPEMGHRQNIERRPQLILSYLPQILLSCQYWIRNLTHLASCCIDQPCFNSKCMIMQQSSSY